MVLHKKLWNQLLFRSKERLRRLLLVEFFQTEDFQCVEWSVLIEDDEDSA